MRIQTIRAASIPQRTRALLRADFDVARGKSKVIDDFRIRAFLPSVRLLLKKGAAVRIMGHSKRPGGTVVPSLSAKIIAKHVEKLLKKKVVFISDPTDNKIFEMRNASREILFFENLRFWPGEEKNENAFARLLARWGDIYVNEAFANSHRDHASMVSVPRILPSYGGLRLEKEIYYLQKVLENPEKPVVVLLGGAKAKTKLALVEKFLRRGVVVLLGGVLANTILAKESFPLGDSLVDQELLPPSGGLRLSTKTRRLELPVDFIVAKSLTGRARVADRGGIKAGESAYDIGPRTIENFKAILARGKTIIWNGPLGIAEEKQFAKATIVIAKHIKNISALKVAGGGDSIAVFNTYKLFGAFTHVSTGGGAMLEFLSGKKLPGIEALRKY